MTTSPRRVVAALFSVAALGTVLALAPTAGATFPGENVGDQLGGRRRWGARQRDAGRGRGLLRLVGLARPGVR